ncbi:MAG: transposase, partial [candidate division NC10 bacterium]
LYPADELRTIYHVRWELELGFDEIKTELLEREETIRSKSPQAVRQEIYGILVAYNLVRLEMERVAAEAHVPPTRISFVAALHRIVDEWSWLAVTSPGAIPSRLHDLRADLKRFILPPRRSERRYPRAVKIKMSNYPRNRRSPTARGVK